MKLYELMNGISGTTIDVKMSLTIFLTKIDVFYPVYVVYFSNEEIKLNSVFRQHTINELIQANIFNQI